MFLKKIGNIENNKKSNILCNIGSITQVIRISNTFTNNTFVPILSLYYLNKYLCIKNKKLNKHYLKYYYVACTVLASKFVIDKKKIKYSKYISYMNVCYKDVFSIEYEIFKTLDFNLNIKKNDLIKFISNLYKNNIINLVDCNNLIENINNNNQFLSTNFNFSLNLNNIQKQI